MCAVSEEPKKSALVQEKAAEKERVQKAREAADAVEFRVRYLTLLSYFADPALVPLFERVYVSPDSFRIPPRYAVRASDGQGVEVANHRLPDTVPDKQRPGLKIGSLLPRSEPDKDSDDEQHELAECESE